jgi:hypothetical protein
MFFYTLEERGPCHEVCEVEVEVIVFGEGVEVAEVELQEVTGSDSADSRHLLLPVLGPLKILSLVSDVDKKTTCARKRVPRNLEIRRPCMQGPARAAFSSKPCHANYDMHGQIFLYPCPDTLLSEVLLVWTNSEMNLAV